MPIRSYAVDVNGFDTVFFHHRTASKARAEAWRHYCHYDDQCTFKRFLEISTIRRTETLPPVGEVVKVCGKPAEIISLTSRGDPKFMYVDSDVVMHAHYSELEREQSA